MSGPRLSTLSWPCSVAAALLPALSAALRGTGPAISVVPASPPDPLVAALRPEEPLERDDIAAVVATSGSAGAPKGVLLTAAALTASARLTHDRLGGPGQWLLALPPVGVAGLQVLVRSLLAGVPPLVLDLSHGFDTGDFAAATSRLTARPSFTALVPTQLVRLLDAGGRGLDALRSYDAVLIGGAPAPPAALATAERESVRVVTTYGATETCGGCVYDGTPLPGVSVRLGGDGVIHLGGPTIAAGYRLNPQLTAAAFPDGWFKTEDRGRLEADGRLTVLGRTDDAILTGGVIVDPVAVENVLVAHPAVAHAAVLGRPDPEWGERVVAVVVVDPVAPSLAELGELVGDRLGSSHVPRELLVVDALPALPGGKLDRLALRALVHEHRR